MSESFNPYHVWLGIPPSEQPPHLYRLLGIAAFEADADVIDHAADRQMAHVRTFQSGKHAAQSQQLLNELAAARVCLLNPERKQDYDAQLKSSLAAAVAVPVGKAVPVALPVKPAAPRARPAAAPADDEAYEVDLPAARPRNDAHLEPAGSLFDEEQSERGPLAGLDVPSIQIRGGNRIDRDAGLMRMLGYMITAVMVLVVVLVLVGIVQRMTGSSGWQEWFTAPAGAPDNAPAPRVVPPPAPEGPAPPAPLPPGA